MSTQRPVSQADARTEKRDAILAAARQVFANRGVNVTMDDIAKAAGVSKGALYLHFASKDELYLHLSAQGAKELLHRLQSARAAANGFESFRALAHAYVGYCTDDPARFRLDAAWLAPGYQVDYRFPMAQEYRAVITESMKICVEAFKAGQLDGSIRADLDAATTVYQLWGALLGLIILRAKTVMNGSNPPQADTNLWSQLAVPTARVIEVESFIPDYIELMMSTVRIAQ